MAVMVSGGDLSRPPFSANPLEGNPMSWKHALGTVVIVLVVLYIVNNVPAIGGIVGQ